MSFSSIRIYIVLLLSLIGNQVMSQALAKFNIHTVGNTAPLGQWYAEYLPPGFDTSTVTCGYPMMIVLHGIGEKGPDDGSQLANVTVHGPAKHIKNGHNMCFTVNGKEECFVVIAPQLHVGNWTPPVIRSVIDDVLNNPNVGPKIDLNRIYLTGLSLGGIGVYWHMINPTHNNPNIFAAFAPIAGNTGGIMNGCSYTAKNVPMWAFHGTNDGTVSYTDDLNLYNSIMGCTSPSPSVEFTFTSYPGVGHNSWDRAYNTGHTYHNPNLYEWFLSKSKKGTTSAGCTVDDAHLITNKNSFCNGDSLIAQTSWTGPGEYHWELDGTIISEEPVFRHLPGPGSHTLKLHYYKCGDCTADTTWTFNVATNHVARINFAGTGSFCDGDSLILSSDTTGGNSWYSGTNLLSNNNNITVKTSGKYYLRLGSGLCASSDSVEVTANVAVVPVISQVDTQLFSTPAATYQWILNGTPISGQTGQFITPTQIGTYTVETVDSNGCSSVSSPFELVAIGIPGAGQDGDFVVYPNPTTGTINMVVHFDRGGDAKVKVIDMRGAKLAEHTYKNLTTGSNMISMNLSNIHHKGGVLVVIFANDKTRTSTVVIE